MLQPVNAYTNVQVCLFCAQFFEDDEGYRPSYTGKLEAMHGEADKADDHEEARYWDPLVRTVGREMGAACVCELRTG